MFAMVSFPLLGALDSLPMIVFAGERTPVGVRMQNSPGNIPEHWLLCHAGRKFSAAVWEPGRNKEELYTVGSVDVERVVEFNNSSAKPGVWSDNPHAYTGVNTYHLIAC
jgi:acid phosphatase